MNIKKIYDLDTIREVEGIGKVANWSDHDAFFEFVDMTTSQSDRFDFESAHLDERVKLELKAYYDSPIVVHGELEYIAFSFDGKYVGLVIGIGTSWWWKLQEIYITNFPLYQAMVSYVTAMYILKPEHIVGETTDIPDLDGRFGTVIDKRYKYNLGKESE
jgi:hypothetical protein